MLFITKATLSAFAALLSFASANTVEFISQDGTDRTIMFTCNPGMAEIPETALPGLSNATVSFPTGWTGNWFAVPKGSPTTPGMLGEISWDAWNGITFFDVSAIVNPNDVNGVKMIYPKISKTPLSGCQSFPCANAYNQPDDIQTLSTTEKDLVCLIGTKAATSRRHARHFVTGHAGSHTS